MTVKVIQGPIEEPVSLEEAKLHLKVDISESDQEIYRMIKTAREQCEAYTGRSFITKTYEVSFHSYGEPIEIPYGPVQSITSVVRVGSDNVETTLTPTEYYTTGVGFVTLSAARRFSLSMGWYADSYKITYVAGYGDATQVPSSIKDAILKKVAELHENREDTGVGVIVSLPLDSQRLLNPFRRNVLI